METQKNTASIATEQDIIIAGGGMAGATLALALRRFLPQRKVLLVEPFPLPQAAQVQTYQPSYDARSTALAWGTRDIYQRLGVWSAIEPHAAPILRIHVSDKGRFGSSRLHAQEQQKPALGYVVDNRWLGIQLLNALQKEPADMLSWAAPAEVVGLEATPAGATDPASTASTSDKKVRVLIRQGETTRAVQAALLVVADGGRSGLREQLGFPVRQQQYGQQALIANVSTQKPHQGWAFERFTEAGPLALLPRAGGDGELGLVWTLADGSLQRLLEASDAEFLQALQETFGWRLGRFTKVGERQSYPLQRAWVEEPVRPGVVLVGNAAQTLHPVAGQGFNLAARGLMALVEALIAGDDRGEALGDLSVLRSYAQLNSEDRAAIMGLSNGLLHLFTDQSPWLRSMRDMGLSALDLAPAAKKLLTRHAMGLGGVRAHLPDRAPSAKRDKALPDQKPEKINE